ncbi:MAG: polymer-forming cytoskeletal protein [Bdellovibrionaceae bacterium]|nr:polymer-forming cytoskeletal protein [Bdellovibrionales bacterium]MCB9253769.1 polymer-forming cytoskeletal protein [Pseudobdellovibrionaceae bacterium]
MVREVSFPTLIAEATRLAGDVTFSSTAHVFGVVEGDVLQHALEPLQVGKSGWIHGNIRSQGTVVIEGRVDGDVVSTTRIQLLPTATVRGRLQAPSIQIRAGAIFEGEMQMSAGLARPVLKAAA